MFNPLFDAFSPFAAAPWAGLPFQFPTSRHAGQRGSKFISDRLHGAAGSLRYKLFVPACYTGAPLPLIVMLHGGGQDADDFALGTGMNGLAEESGYLVVYPEQSANANWSRCWNWFDAARHASGRGEPALIAGVVDKVMGEYAVDRTRVYVAGLSSGGAMAVILGQAYPGLFRAVGCHSGLAYGCASDQYSAMRVMRDGHDPQAPAAARLAGSVPTIVFHGDRDYTVHPQNGLGVVQQALDVYRDGAAHVSAAVETGDAAGRAFTRVSYRGVAGEVVAEHWTVHGGGHAWFGGNTLGGYTDPAGPDASREMLRFFEQQGGGVGN